jgi:hypothetical protein
MHEAEKISPGFEFTDKNLTYKTDINSHSAIVGLSLRF